MSVSVALVIQHAMRMRRIILSSVTLVALQYFPLYHKRHDFRENVIDYAMHFDFLNNLCL
jgi:DNA-directed RNA polymerase alpha subunit